MLIISLTFRVVKKYIHLFQNICVLAELCESCVNVTSSRKKQRINTILCFD